MQKRRGECQLDASGDPAGRDNYLQSKGFPDWTFHSVQGCAGSPMGGECVGRHPARLIGGITEPLMGIGGGVALSVLPTETPPGGNATKSSVRATVTAVYGGKVTTNRTSAMGLPRRAHDGGR